MNIMPYLLCCSRRGTKAKQKHDDEGGDAQRRRSLRALHAGKQTGYPINPYSGRQDSSPFPWKPCLEC